MTIRYSPDEIIVVARPGAQLRSQPGAAISGSPSAKVSGLNSLLKSAKVELLPLFDSTEERARARMLGAPGQADHEGLDPGTFYSVNGDVKNVKKLLTDLLNEPSVDGAYLKPAGEPPMFRSADQKLPEEAPLDMSPAVTPDFNANQIYLGAATAGVDARFAWTKPGGRGENVRVIDLEWGWNFSHEDLLVNSGGLLDGSNAADTDHGTAVLGVIGGDHNGRGVMGIAPNARLSAISFVGNPSATAIRKAADRLGPGDIILLEIHRPGPRHGFASRSDQAGYIGIEWWPDDFAAILYATSRGILVVEAAGNGGENFDDPIYAVRPAGFPASWRNPFNRANPQCGAILVGAGAPPPGTHGRNHGADRSRLAFSNYGAAVDVQGWGREVSTTGRSWGVADLHNGGTNAWYTDQFSGTSSASPMVVGVLACAQGWVRAAGRPLLTPASARTLLRNTGSPQQNEPGRPATQRIGKRPNLRALHAQLFPKPVKELLKDTVKDKEIHKEQVKDVKELAKEQLKEQVKEISKEISKEVLKEGQKELKEKDKDLVEGGGLGGLGLQQPTAAAEQRLAALEATVAALVQALQGAQATGGHFIGSELRPDVGAAGWQALQDDTGTDGTDGDAG